MNTAEPGYTTTEFWLTIVGVVAALLNPLHVTVTPEQQYGVASLLVAAYALARGWRKSGTAG